MSAPISQLPRNIENYLKVMETFKKQSVASSQKSITFLNIIQKELQKLNPLAEQLKAKLQNNQDLISQFQNERTSNKQKLDAMSAQQVVLSNRVNVLENHKKQAFDEYKKLEFTNAELQKQIDSNKKETDELEAKKVELAKAVQDNGSLRDQFRVIDDKVKAKELENYKLKGDLQNNVNRINELNATIDDLKQNSGQTVQELTDQIQSLTAEKAAINNTIGELNQKIGELTNENQQNKAIMETVNARLQDLTKDMLDGEGNFITDFSKDNTKAADVIRQLEAFYQSIQPLVNVPGSSGGKRKRTQRNRRRSTGRRTRRRTKKTRRGRSRRGGYQYGTIPMTKSSSNTTSSATTSSPGTTSSPMTTSSSGTSSTSSYGNDDFGSGVSGKTYKKRRSGKKAVNTKRKNNKKRNCKKCN